MADVVDLSGEVSLEEGRRRWAAEQCVKVLCAHAESGGLANTNAIDYLLDKMADALDAYAKDGTVTRHTPPGSS